MELSNEFRVEEKLNQRMDMLQLIGAQEKQWGPALITLQACYLGSASMRLLRTAPYMFVC